MSSFQPVRENSPSKMDINFKSSLKKNISALPLTVCAFGVLIVAYFFCDFILRSPFILTKSFTSLSPSFKIYAIILIAYLGVMVLQYVFRPHTKRIIILLASVMFALFLLGKEALLFFLVAYIFYRIVYLDIASFAKIILCLFLYAFPIYAIVLKGAFSSALPSLYVFIMLFPLRFILYFHYSAGCNFQRKPYLDYVLYIFFPLYFIIPPFIVIMPEYNHFVRSLVEKKGFLSVWRSGIRHILRGLICMLILIGLKDVLFIHAQPSGAGAADRWLGLCAFKVIDFIGIVLITYSRGSILLGMMHGWGYGIKSPFSSPFLSRNIVDFFNRLFWHYKNYLMNIFFLPFQIATRFAGIYPSLFISSVATIVASWIVSDIFALGMGFCNAWQAWYSWSFPFGDMKFMTESWNITFNEMKFVEETAAIVNFFKGPISLPAIIDEILGKRLTFGIAIGIQLMYNYAVTQGRQVWLRRLDGNIMARGIQVAAMIVFITKLFL